MNYMKLLSGTSLRCYQLSKEVRPRLLATFDFDNTIIAGDCYEAVGELLKLEENTKELKQLVQQVGWIHYMRSVLQMLHERHGIGAQQIGETVRQLPAVSGMKCLLRRLAQVSNLDMCILSDANEYFIEQWLEANRLKHIFGAIFTNPTRIAPNGYLQVEPYWKQTHCEQCPENLCKGSVLRRLMSCPDWNYERIAYVGDGCNDLCPIRCLREKDVACIRRGEELHEKLPCHIEEIRAKIYLWRTGHDLFQQLKQEAFL